MIVLWLKRRFLKDAAAFLLLFGFFVCPAAAQNQISEVRADSLFKQHMLSEAFEVYHGVLKKNHNDVSALWHSSLLHSRLGHLLKTKKQEKKYYIIARKQALRALKLKPESSMANYAMAVSLGRMAVISSVKKKVSASRKIKEYAVRALQADSTNDGAWNVLGRWNYGISGMNSFERMAAKVLFGGVPKGASYQKAVKYNKKAIELNPAVVGYYYNLAQAYHALGKKEMAVEACQAGLKKPPIYDEGVLDKKNCQDLIAHLH
jgi:tetratricopeptide (TPR) repeat protein